MATLALGALGAAAGSALLPAGFSFLGATVAGATIGSQIGTLAGSMVDNALFGASGQRRALDGPRLGDLHVLSSTEGAPIPRVYGRARIGGQIIWATSLEEEAVEVSAAGGGKGAFAGQSNAGLQYQYYANFAVGLCQGEINAIGRVWADNREISLADITWRLHTGTQDQLPDALIEARQGSAAAPAYRGLAYIVFERLPLSDFGNRIPQLSFEVIRAVDDLESQIRGVVLIPGSGEFAYAPSPVTRRTGTISSVAENTHTHQAQTDWSASLDDLQAKLPNAKSVSLVVSWFGDDLRAGQCRVRPLVERSEKNTEPLVWSVAGLTRDTAFAVSMHDGRPAYGGTPSDDTVVAAIRDLKLRGLSVVFSPFLLMDIAAGNALPDPYTDASSQPPYPWRGRVTVTPAPGRPSTADKTVAAATQLSSFIGTVSHSAFAISGDTVTYAGPDEWSFRRFILHYAHLCKAAGGVDAFVLCSELRGLTTARSTGHSFPFVDALAALAADVRTILGPATKVLYAADWSEYFGHQPADGSGDVYFHLDPLWSSLDIDAIGLDMYWPLADWRDGRDHLDFGSGAHSVYDLAYLKQNIFGGEGYDWFYASQADRDAQQRTVITDSAGKPWVFRYKDLRHWWSSPHFNRPGGVESATQTAWVPQSKPFWLMEIGCPAVDKGANQPNVFIDAKSAESALPHFSSGVRDDLMQRRVLQALTEAFDPAHPGYVANANPVSTVTGARMLDVSRTHVYCWDARPYPAFPQRREVWGDAANWETGHWLNGRAASAPLPALVSTLLADFGFSGFDASTLNGTVAGFVVDRLMSAREALQPLELAAFFDSIESEGRIVFRPRGGSVSRRTIAAADTVETTPLAPLIKLARAQETDLPASAKITYITAGGDYASAVAEARRSTTASARTSTATLPIVLEPAMAQSIAETWLNEVWVARDSATFVLPPSDLALEPGDILTIDTANRRAMFRITETGDRDVREIEAQAIDLDLYQATPAPLRPTAPEPTTASGPPLVLYLDIPAAETDPPQAAYVAAAQTPWPGTVAVYRSPDTSGFTLDTLLSRPATTGVTVTALSPGPSFRVDHTNTLDISLDRGSLQSVSTLSFLAGANLAAIEISAGVWELIQFQTAVLIAPSTYRLTNLLRGQRGTSPAAIPSGARFVLLDAAVRPLGLSTADLGLALNWKAGPARQNIASPSYVSASQVFHGKGLAPRAPVHVNASRSGSGDIMLRWIRQTRLGGDNWDQIDVPLGETSERYDVDILDGPTVVRTISVSEERADYSAVQQIEDFGALQSSLAVRVFQVSPTHGRGAAASAII